MEQKTTIVCSSRMMDQYKKSIEALVDDELDLKNKQRTLDLIRHIPELQTYYSTLLKQKYALQKWWKYEKDKVH